MTFDKPRLCHPEQNEGSHIYCRKVFCHRYIYIYIHKYHNLEYTQKKSYNSIELYMIKYNL